MQISKFFLPLLAVFMIEAVVGQQLPSPPAQDTGIAPGDGSFTFTDARGNAERPLQVYYHRPAAWNANAPIVFVMHGLLRNSKKYCHEWSDLADKANFMVVCPTFLEKDYPTSAYQWGNMFDAAGQPIPQEKWTFTAVEHLFDEVKRLTNSSAKDYYIFGHSAGGQFVHRFVLFMPQARYKRAIAANPGWYTLPDYSGHKYPYGLRNSGLSPENFKRSLSRNFVLMLGDEDNDPNDPEMNQGRRAEEQGRTRFERGENFFKQAQAAATAAGANFQWKLQTVPNAHHSDREMGVAAAPILFQN
jgi:poly(3-hydroxybutyrate) depolymerase